LRSAAQYFGINKIAKDEVIFEEGDVGAFMCVVHSGAVAVIKTNQNEEQVEVTTLVHGRAFGEMAVLDGERRSATCRAAEDSILLTLSKEALDKMLEAHPRIGARIIRAIAVSLSRRLRLAVGQLVDHIV
jgi:CRP-like cAMP-binding protein